jgi:hypothetical protein
MLNRILQTLLLGLAAILLTTGIAFSSPLPGSVLMAAHTPDQQAAISQPAPSPQPTGSSQTETRSPAKPDLKGDRNAKVETSQPIQADPSKPYDPYDYDAIRKMDREIYGEVKGDWKG